MGELWVEDLDAEGRDYWLEAMVRVAGLDPEKIAEEVATHPDRREAYVAIVQDAYERAVADGLMEFGGADAGHEAGYRLTELGLARLAILEGRTVFDGQHRSGR